MRALSITLTALAMAWGSGASMAIAQAQPSSDPVIAAYRDYRAAEQRDDALAAEAAVARALALSEARDAGGGSTAVLAMDLATVRMEMDHKAEALAPARRALALARAGAKGIDELAARLMIGEAELTISPKADETDLLTALHDADARGADIDDYAYPAAVVLASAASQAGRWVNAGTAWQSAQRHIHAAPGDPNRALAAVFRGEGLTLIGAHKDPEARAAFHKALDLLAPLAPESADGAQVTAAEIEYADVMAWMSTVDARQRTEEGDAYLRHRAPRDPGVAQIELPGRPPLCHGTVSANPLPTFPEDILQQSSVGAGALRIQTDDKGAVTSAILLASVPGDEFRRSLMDPSVHWFFKPDVKQTPGCRLDSKDRLVNVIFTIGGSGPH